MKKKKDDKLLALVMILLGIGGVGFAVWKMYPNLFGKKRFLPSPPPPEKGGTSGQSQSYQPSSSSSKGSQWYIAPYRVGAKVKVVNVINAVNVRSGTGLQYDPPISSAKKGTIFTVLETKRDNSGYVWCRVMKNGWIRQDKLKIVH